MSIIPKDPYADKLLLQVEDLKAGLRIKRDAYADKLLNFTFVETDLTLLQVDEKTPADTINKEDEKRDK